MYFIERKTKILELLADNHRVNVEELAELFDVSKETIRRDLRLMEKDGLLLRTHGGAVPAESKTAAHLQEAADSTISAHSTSALENTAQPSLTPVSSTQDDSAQTSSEPGYPISAYATQVSSAPANPSFRTPEPPVGIRSAINRDIKNKLCQYAASLIENGDMIFVDNSSTTLTLSGYVPDNITVTFITNSLPFLMEAARQNKPNQTFICLGGLFKCSNLSTYGGITGSTGSEYYPSKAIISCTGITAAHGVTDASIEETSVKRMMISNSKQTIVLADSTKFCQDGQFFLCGYDKIHQVITNRLLENCDYSFLTGRNITVHTPD